MLSFFIGMFVGAIAASITFVLFLVSDNTSEDDKDY
jgi:gas vesicle protein